MSTTALPETSYESYVKLTKLKANIKELQAKLSALDTDKRLLEAEIITGTLKRKGTHTRLLPTGRVLKITRVDIDEKIIQPEDVGTVSRKGYTYYKMKEE